MGVCNQTRLCLTVLLPTALLVFPVLRGALGKVETKMLIAELRELRAYMSQYGCTSRRADKGDVKVVQLLDCHGCIWRSGKGATARDAWYDLVIKVQSSDRHPRKPSKAALLRDDHGKRSPQHP